MTVEGTIEPKSINFGYPSGPNKVNFNDFDLIVPSGRVLPWWVTMVMVTASSIISLVLRFYGLTSTKVIIGGNMLNILFSTSYSNSTYMINRTWVLLTNVLRTFLRKL